MTDRDTMVGRIQDETRRTDSNFQTIIVEHINDAIAHYQKKRFYFNESRAVTFSTSSGTFQYTFSGAAPDIGTQFYRIDLVVLEDDNNDYELKRRDYRDIELLIEGSSTNNRPYNYAYLNQSLLLYPIPDDSYTVRLTGHIKLAAPAAGGTANNDWMTEAFDLIRARALWSLNKRVLHKWDTAAQFKTDEGETLSALAGATNDKAGSNTLVPTQF